MRALLKSKVKGLLHYPPVPALSADNLYGYLDALYRKRSVAGPVVEVGCAAGGTTALACQFLRRIGCDKAYVCLDTFGGFVKEHLETDHRIGLTARHDDLFRWNSARSFSDDLTRWGVRERVTIRQGDICTIDDEAIPTGVSVALLDVDLRDPTYVGLQRLWEKLADGGIILVDDCSSGTSWVGANVGYRDFVDEAGLEPKYFLGFGVVERTAGGAGVPWEFSAAPNSVR